MDYDYIDVIQPGRMESVQRLNSTNLLEVARTYIKDYIVGNNLKSGDPLPTEKELSSTLGLSRTVIREALKGLQELGITESIQGKGHFLREFNFDAALTSFDFIIKPSLRSFKDLLEVRMYLESVFLTRDVFLFTKDDFDELAALIDDMKAQIDKGVEEDELINIHSLFHQKLYKHSGNIFLSELIDMFSSMQHKLIVIHGYHTSDRREFVQGHRDILDSLKRREPEMVRGVLIRHFSEPLTWVQQRIREESEQNPSIKR